MRVWEAEPPAGVEPLEWIILCDEEVTTFAAKTNRSLTSVREVALALGRLGGHLNRKSDGLPGWITLWRGYLTLPILVEGVRLFHKLEKTG